MVTSIIICYVIMLLCTLCVDVVIEDVSTILAVNISNLVNIHIMGCYCLCIPSVPLL